MASKCNYLQACRRLNATRAQCQSKLHLSTCWFISCQSQACPASPLNPLVPFGHALRFSHCYWPAFEWQSVIWYSCPGTFLNTSLKVATPPPRLSSYYSIHLCEGEMFAQVASLSLSLASLVSLCLNKLPLKQNMLLSHYKQEKWKYLCPCAKITTATTTTATTTATTIASRDKSNPEGFYIFLMLLQLEQANGVDRTSDHTTLHTLLPAKCVVFPPLSLPLCI